MTGSSPDHSDTVTFPVWQDDGKTDVQSLFMNPSFVPDTVRTDVVNSWYDHMTPFSIFLFDKQGQANNVFAKGPAIFEKLIPSGNMPKPGPDVVGGVQVQHRFPPEACEQFRVWYNQGGRVKTSDPIPSPNVPANQIPSNLLPARPFVTPANPVWDSAGTEDDIKLCFTNPPWILGGVGHANSWRESMLNFQFDATTDPPTMFDLQIYEHVKGWARNVFTHVASQAMPIEAPFFSDEAVEAVRLWYNQGCPENKSQIGTATLPSDPIPVGPVEKPYRMRKDINTLTEAELTTYRMALLNLNSDKAKNSEWQTGGVLHANWCLHYMQASFPWHRAHLLWLENQLGGPIPYWNFFSSKATDPTHPDSGLPQAFLDDTFKDSNGVEHPNPLRHALARGGVSRASSTANPLMEVQRAQPFQQADPTVRAAYITKYVPTYLDQVYQATQMTSIGDVEGAGFAFTFATADLTPTNPDSFYKGHLQEFDGVLEQAHDNLHGWTGPDMANNSYAAFDPLFWSFHANFDRIFETWMRANDTQWSSNFPLRPFNGREGTIGTIEGDPHVFNYTNIGNMVMNSRALGYTYAPPGSPDYAPASHKINMAVAPVVFFPNVKCTNHTYIIHVALDTDAKALTEAAIGREPGYIGSVTRLGMGPDNGNNRCIKSGVVRRLEATKAVADLGDKFTLKPGSEVPLKLLVLEDVAGGKPRRVVPESEYTGKDWSGFRPVVVWNKPVAGVCAH